MRKKLALIIAVLPLTGCANATRTFYWPTLEERTINLDVEHHKKLEVPPDYRDPKLPEPKYKDKVLDD